MSPPKVSDRLAGHRVRPIDVELAPSISFRLFEIKNEPDKYWSKIWPAAVATSQWLLEQPKLTMDPVVELGCGPGLVSLVLARLGHAVEATDREPGALALAEMNVAESGLLGITVRPLDWATGAVRPCDLLVGSDVLYEPESPQVLFELIELRGALRPGGRLILSASEARLHVVHELLLRLRGAGYSILEELREVAFRGRTERITIWVARRPATGM